MCNSFLIAPIVQSIPAEYLALGRAHIAIQRKSKRQADPELDAFLADFTPTEVSASVNVPSSAATKSGDATMDASVLLGMFEKAATGTWRFKFGESDQHECKESFGFKYADKWLKAVAALANNRGGYVLFGIKDKHIVDDRLADDSYQVVGLNTTDFEHADPADFTLKIKSTFDPTPRVTTTLFGVDSFKIGILYVSQHPGRPIIATKSEGSIKEGDIYYRYPGQSARIKYSDLRAVLDERDRMVREQVLPLVAKLLSRGPRDAMVVDLAEGVLSDDKHTILIGEDLLERIKFIREGEFKQTEGEPTLRLVGDVQTVGADGTIIQKAFVTPTDLIADFLELRSPYDPTEYIRCAIEGGNGAWLPMHYYARQAKFDRDELADFIMKTSAPQKRKKAYADRATGIVSAFRAAGGGAAPIISALKAGIVPDVTDIRSAVDLGRAVTGLDAKPNIALDKILARLKECKFILQNSVRQTFMSTLRRAIARLDELYFGQ